VNDDPWTSYWRQEQLHSCIAVGSLEDQETLAAFWGDFARSLEPDARVLDLATGNGVVPVQLLTAVPTLRITGVDRAAIAPARHVPGEPLLSRVRFCGDVDLAGLPRLGGPFDALTSQFGVEYAGVEVALRVLRTHLVEGGVFQWLLHHAQSAVVRSAAEDRAELERLTAPEGVLSAVSALELGARGVADVDESVRSYLRAPVRRTRRISGAVVALVERAVSAAEQGDGKTLRAIVRHLASSVAAERQRLSQLGAAALDADDVGHLAGRMAAGGITVSRQEAFVLGTDRTALIGWVMAGRRA